MSVFGSQYLKVPENYRSEAFNVTIGFADKPPFDRHTPDFIFPFYAVLEFIGYMGWIKVAETLLNPFGDDDMDYEINYLIDRNVQVRVFLAKLRYLISLHYNPLKVFDTQCSVSGFSLI